MTTPLDAKHYGYQASLLRQIDNHFERPIEEIGAAYDRRIESRRYSLIDQPGKERVQVQGRKKQTVKKKKSGEMRSISAIMCDRFDSNWRDLPNNVDDAPITMSAHTNTACRREPAWVCVLQITRQG